MERQRGAKSKKDLYRGWDIPTYPTNENIKPPEWLDQHLLEKGQKFACDHLYAISFSDIVSLLFLFSYKEGLEPLIFTGQSGCVFSAFNRYLSTASRVTSWYQYDLLDPNSKARQNLAVVKHMHTNVTNTMKSLTPQKLAVQTRVERPMSNILEHLRKDLSQFGRDEDQAFIYKDAKDVYLNQWQMAFTQFGFIGLLVMYPEKLGIPDATDEDLEGLVHVWAVIGHMLGIQDEYNWCLEGLDAVRKRGLVLKNSFILPHLQSADASWEHMSRSMAEGISLYMPSISFEKLLLYLCWVLDVPTDSVWKASPWSKRLWFLFTRFMLTKAVYLPGMKSFFNWLYLSSVGMAKKADAQWLANAKEKAQIYKENFF